MKCIRKLDGLVLAQTVEPAQTFMTRLFGLMLRRAMRPGSGLWLEPCKQIHMFFMRFAIDVLFLDSDKTIVHVIENFKPWRVSPMVWKARGVLELPAGTLAGRVKQGDSLDFVP